MTRRESPYVFRDERSGPAAEPASEAVVIVDDEVVRYEDYAADR